MDARGQIVIDPFLGRDPIGILCFGPTHFAAQFMKRDRSDEERLPNIQAKNNTAAVNGYDAYFGTYSVDEAAGTLATQLRINFSCQHRQNICQRCACTWQSTPYPAEDQRR